MNRINTTIVLFFTLSLASHTAMGQQSSDGATELSSLPAKEQQRVATLQELANTLSAHYQAHRPADKAQYDHEHFDPLHWLAYVGDSPEDGYLKKSRATLLL
ncbi:MAG: hypothetical protein AAF400_02985 [Bacteroidota bacterium]